VIRETIQRFVPSWTTTGAHTRWAEDVVPRPRRRARERAPRTGDVDGSPPRSAKCPGTENRRAQAEKPINR